MKTRPEIAVTLSDELLESLRTQAVELKVPLRWLVAGLICDTLEAHDESDLDRPGRPTRHVA